MQIKSHETNGRLYVNALTFESAGIVELGIVAINRHTGQERYIDAMLPDDRFSTVLEVIKLSLGRDWALYESFPIESVQPVTPATAVGVAA